MGWMTAEQSLRGKVRTFLTSVRTVSGAHSASFSVASSVSFLGVKHLEYETDHLRLY